MAPLWTALIPIAFAMDFGDNEWFIVCVLVLEDTFPEDASLEDTWR